MTTLNTDASAALTDNSAILTVSQLNQQVRLLLEQHIGRVWLSGEVSNFSQPASGHWYFTLKDAGAQVRCAMFRQSNRRVGFVPRAGQQVLMRAAITLYEPRGDYQVIADSLHPAGEGLLQQRYQQLKQQLAAEGLFDSQHKMPLPPRPRCVGVITSASGAALHDILQVLRRRDPSLAVVIYPTAVQGEEACGQIVQALALANQRAECDVLIVGRGGGSLEDLWCFNDERVARAMFASHIPLVSAVGHETDVTIADFVADVRAPTPSAAAEMVSCDQQEQMQRLQSAQQRLAMAWDYYHVHNEQRLSHLLQRLQQLHPQARLMRWQAALTRLCQRLTTSLQGQLWQHHQRYQQLNQQLNQQSPVLRLHQYQAVLTQTDYRLQQAIEQQITGVGHRFSSALAQLEAVSPLATLARGYSVTRDAQGCAVKYIRQVNEGELMMTRVVDGWLTSQLVKRVEDAGQE